ncbi:MAG: hypothetical protein ACJ780_09735 [Solirubrobacteraceae bacterium]
MAVTAEVVENGGTAVKPLLIELAGVHKVYRTGKLEYPALRGVDLAIEDGDMSRSWDRRGAGSRRS